MASNSQSNQGPQLDTSEEQQPCAQNEEQAQQPQLDRNQPENDSINTRQKTISSKKWSLMVYGLDENNLPLLSGILGKELPGEVLRANNSYTFEMNNVNVEVHNAKLNKSHEEIDLLLMFVSIDRGELNHEEVNQKIKEITENHQANVWKHSIFVLMQADTLITEFQEKKQGNISVRFEATINVRATDVKRYLKSAIGNVENDYIDSVFNCIPTGRQEEPDLPTLYKKWLSVLWHACFFVSKDDAMPAILKLSQNRIIYDDVPNRDLIRVPFHDQKIYTPAVNLAYMIYNHFKAAGGGTAAAACIGAIIGAFAIGIPTFGAAAKLGLVIGAVIGGGVGAGLSGAIIGIRAMGKKMRITKEIEINERVVAHEEASKLKLFYMETLHNFAYTSSQLLEWVESNTITSKPLNCKIAVTGVKGEGISTLTAAIAQKKMRVNDQSRFYMHQVVPGSANILAYDIDGFQIVGHMQRKAQDIVKEMRKNGIHLLIFVIPMTNIDEDEFPYSAHVEAFKRLSEEEPGIFSNTVIALTHAKEVAERYDPQSGVGVAEFFKSELDRCKRIIRYQLHKRIRLQEAETIKVPIIPVGHEHDEPPIDLSEPNSEQPHNYHWLSQLLMGAMAVTKAEGLPTLIKCNRQRMAKYPEQFTFQLQQQKENEDPMQKAQRLLIEAQCFLFSEMGLKWYKKNSGETVGLIMGTNDTQTWSDPPEDPPRNEPN